jgi:hypothetical protein
VNYLALLLTVPKFDSSYSPDQAKSMIASTGSTFGLARGRAQARAPDHAGRGSRAYEHTKFSTCIEVLEVKPRHKPAIVLLLPRTDIKVLKDAFVGMVGSISDLNVGSGQ